MTSTCPALTFQAAPGIAPVADAFSTTVYSDVVDASKGKWIRFLRFTGVGATGTSTITVNACDDTSASNETAVVFKYRQYISSTDTWGALTDATTSGFLLTAGTNNMVDVWVDANVIANTGYRYVRAKYVEGTDSPVLGGVLIEVHGTNYQPAVGSLIP